jgi:DNA polymerase-1
MIPAKPEAFQLMMEGSAALADIEHNGMRIDVDYLNRVIKWTGEKVASLESALRQDEVFATWRKIYGENTDLGKRDQLADILFNHIGFEVKKFTKGSENSKNKKPATDEEAFEHIDLPFLKRWNDHEKLKRCRTTDLIGTLTQTDHNGLLHPFFHLHFATTYRSSSSAINFQNKPNRDKRLAKLVRQAFIPRSGDFVLIEADFGALEFRGAANFWDDPDMIAYASDPKLDIHRDMGAECYLLETAEVAKPVRADAKNKFVFPKLYGSTYKNIAKNLWAAIARADLRKVDGTPIAEHLKTKGIHSESQYIDHIKRVETKFEEKFPHWCKQKDVWWNSYCENGEFPLLTGFVCRGIYSYNFLMNTPIQGPSFHLLLWSLTKLNYMFKKYKMKSLVIGQIHDSIAVDAHKSELQNVLDLIDRIMTTEVRKHWKWVQTPLLVEIDVATTNWFEKKPVHRTDGQWVLTN